MERPVKLYLGPWLVGEPLRAGWALGFDDRGLVVAWRPWLEPPFGAAARDLAAGEYVEYLAVDDLPAPQPPMNE